MKRAPQPKRLVAQPMTAIIATTIASAIITRR
jgi:hypothetical protein